MYPTPAEANVVKAAEALMVETMARYDPSHDALHVTRVRRTALQIALQLTPQPDLFVTELAALLHDVLDKKYVSPANAADPYAFFLPFFQSVQADVDLINDGRAKTVARIVENVSWTTEKNLRAKREWGAWHDSCIELHCVQDADRLDAIGAFGIMRCAAYSAVTNHPLHAPLDDPRQPDSAIQHFHDKLVHIKERLKTTPGKHMGEKRHQRLVDFIAAVDDELA